MIRAPPERVWAVLIDFKRYPQWNPFIRAVGRREAGNMIEAILRPPGRRPVTFRPTVTSVVRNRELQWLGRLVIPKLFDGSHTMLIEPIEGGMSRFIQKETFEGLPVPLTGKLFDSTKQGFEEMNLALKERVENWDRAKFPAPDNGRPAADTLL